VTPVASDKAFPERLLVWADTFDDVNRTELAAWARAAAGRMASPEEDASGDEELDVDEIPF
jgi:hypothetical protein